MVRKNHNKNSGEKIPESKYILHIRFCSSNVKRCEICNEVITIVDEEQHIKEKHTEKECEYCNKKFKPDLFEEHKKNCNCRLVECQYCELKVQFNELKEHEYLCGSKTRKCINCGKLIPLKDYNEHMSEGCFDIIIHDENEDFIIKGKYNDVIEPKDEEDYIEKNRRRDYEGNNHRRNEIAK